MSRLLELSGPFAWMAVLVVAVATLLVFTLMLLAARYKRCPSDRILVIYGKVGKGQSSHCIHGGGTFVWPLVQSYSFMSLTPITIPIPLKGALSLQNIRINVPSTFTVGISTEPAIMNNAAERLLLLAAEEIEQMAREIIFGQLRLTVASLTIEQINQDRESFLTSIRKNVEPELNKIGLYLINVNITDITDESGYIEAIGKKAASEAINRAKVDVAEQNKMGAIGETAATREKEIRVAENQAGSEKGKKKAEADMRVFVQQQESQAVIGEAVAIREKEIRVAENVAGSEKGKKTAEADRRVYVQQQEALAVKGETVAKANIAAYNAELTVKRADAAKRGEVAERMATAQIQKAQYIAERERLNAEVVVQQEAERKKIEVAAEAEAERIRRIAKGNADATLMNYQAEAEGLFKVLASKARGYESMVNACAGDPKAAATLLMIEKLEDVVAKQVEAIKDLKIDKITVWDSGRGGEGASTANFLSSLIGSLPPLHELAKMAGVEMPATLGKVTPDARPVPARRRAAPAVPHAKPDGSGPKNV